jgi:hypothetical protein
MHNDHCVGRSDEGGSKNVPRTRDALIHASYRDFLDSNQMITRIEKDHAQRFFAESPHIGPDEFVDQFG